MLRERRFDDPVFLVGADQFADFLAWKEPDGVLELARLGVATRPGFPRASLDPVLRGARAPRAGGALRDRAAGRVLDEVRERAARGEPIDMLVPRAVAAEIERVGLYRSDAPRR